MGHPKAKILAREMGRWELYAPLEGYYGICQRGSNWGVFSLPRNRGIRVGSTFTGAK